MTLSRVVCLGCDKVLEPDRLGMTCSCGWRIPSPPYHHQTVDVPEYTRQRLDLILDQIVEIQTKLRTRLEERLNPPGGRMVTADPLDGLYALGAIGDVTESLVKYLKQERILASG